MKQSGEKVYLNSGNADVLRLVDKASSTILDVGCGGGIMARHLGEMGHIVDGITISPEEFRAAKQFTRNIFIHNLESGLPAELLSESYDYVICSHVLEHIVYPKQLLNDVYRVLKPGGAVIVALPNIMHYKSRLRLVRGKFEYEDAGIWDYTHVKWYTIKSAPVLLESHNFKLQYKTVTGELPLNSLFSKILPISLRRSIYKMLSGMAPGLFGYQILLKASKP